MSDISLILLTAAALLAMGLSAWLFAARRRSGLRKARLLAAVRRRQSEAWQRLSHSSAGAP